MIITGADLKEARNAMGLTLRDLSDLVRVGKDSTRGAKYLREIENGVRPLSGPLAVATELLMEKQGLSEVLASKVLGRNEP